MAGYRPSSFIFFACLWTETESKFIYTQNRNEANIKRYTILYNMVSVCVVFVAFVF